tara:strand:+ start:7957 stop:8673 length:717 start_codon:yes stop_codon:yes gene_type:complete
MRNKALTFLNESVKGFFSLIYPNNCVICGTELPDQNDMICFKCFGDLHYTHFEKYDEPTKADELFWGRIKIEHVYSLLFYEKGTTTQSILHKIKYQEGQKLGEYMGRLMGKRLLASKWIEEVDAVFPIPLHSKKNFKRGYNQSRLIADGFSDVVSIPVVEGISRRRHHESQTRKSKEERWENVRSIFQVVPEKCEDIKHVLIIDDVLTTGSTLESAAQEIKTYNPEIKVSFATIAIAD